MRLAPSIRTRPWPVRLQRCGSAVKGLETHLLLLSHARRRHGTGSRRSLSPKALATFSSVARVGLPSSDSAS